MPHKVDASRFAMQPSSDIPRSAFDIQHTHKTTFNTGFLVPVYIDEILPGDSCSLRMTAFARLSTPIVPVMDNLYFESHFFFVPCRLVWSNWERFMGEQTSPSDTTVFLVPYVTILDANISAATIFDYMGITVNNEATGSVNINALPFRAYNLIWNEWFRDQNLVTPATVLVDDGPDPVATYTMRQRGKRHDYFTTCLPWPEKPMNIQDFSTTPMSGAFSPGGRYIGPTAGAPVTGLGVGSAETPTAGSATIQMSGGRAESYDPHWTTANDAFIMAADGGGVYPNVRVLVNDIRTAVMVQGFLERNARGGTRYAEIVRSQFRVQSPDARLQRPEYLGGGRSMVSVNPIAQTSASGVAGTTTVLGEQAGIGSVVAEHGFSQSFTEHGYIIGLVSVRPDLTYQQGINRMWRRRTQFDFYWPALAHLGEQAVMTGEIFSNGTSADWTVFGYQERWAEYKYKPSRTSGYFRSTDATPLDMWHFGEEFTAAPVLNTAFITQGFDMVDRALQSSTNFGQQYLMDALFSVRMVRAMPMFSIPGVGARL